MFEELNERRKAVERNIAKGFGIDDADLNFEKALEDELEKGRAKKQFNIGDTFTRHGVTYKCTGISVNTGRPTWSKVKDGEGSKQEQQENKEDKQLTLEEIDSKIDKLGSKLTKLKMKKTYPGTEESKKQTEGIRKIEAELDSLRKQRNSLSNKESEKKGDKKEVKEEKQDCAVEWMEFTFNGGIKKKRKEFDSQAKARSFMDKLFTKDSFYQITATSGLDGDKKVYKEDYPNTPEGRQQAANDVMNEAGERIKKQMKEKQEKEDKKEEQKKPKKLSEMKKGDTVALVMDRYNPQLGNYVVIQKKQIEGTTSKSFVVDGKKFDKVSGDRRDPSSSVYGSTTYSIMTEQELRKHVKDGKYKGGRISGVNPFEEESE